MKRVAVSSSSVATVGYDPSSFILEIEFRNGGVYQYRQVPAAAHRLLMQAKSIGDYVNTIIKPRFDAERVQ
jgi:hypothetical protein